MAAGVNFGLGNVAGLKRHRKPLFAVLIGIRYLNHNLAFVNFSHNLLPRLKAEILKPGAGWRNTGHPGFFVLK
jgi:hypothetical protein